MNSTNTVSTPAVKLIASFDTSRGKTVPVVGERFLIGRDSICQLRPSSPMVSRYHAEIRIAGEDVYLRDLNSSNGTFLNDAPVTTEVPLEDGDTMRIGPLEFSVSIQAPAEPSSHVSFDDDQLPSDAEVAKWLLPQDDSQRADKTHKAR